MKKFKYAFVVGRFQPLHLGHEQLINAALGQAEKVIVFLGSSQESGTKKNPFSPEQRKLIFYNTFKQQIGRFIFIPLPDTDSNSSWIFSITEHLDKIVNQASLCNVCFNKDKETTENNDILKALWQSTVITVNPIYPDLSATDIRRIVFEDLVCPLQLSGTHLSNRSAKTIKHLRDKNHYDLSF